MGFNPILFGPSCLHHFKITILYRQFFKLLSKERTLRKIGIKIPADHPMIFLLCSISVKHLHLHSRQIIWNNIARNKYCFRREIINFLYRMRIGNFFLQRKYRNLRKMNIPQQLVIFRFQCFLINGIQYINSIFVFTKQNNTHNSIVPIYILPYVSSQNKSRISSDTPKHVPHNELRQHDGLSHILWQAFRKKLSVPTTGQN